MSRIALLACAFLASTAQAAVPPRAELAALTAQLAKTPSDDALREKIIKLAAAVKPAPAISKEARRRMVRGGTAIKEASSPADYRAAALEFEKAALEAPWWGDAYYNLAVARDKAKNFAGALAALKLARLASPGNQDAEDLASAVEFRMEKENSPEGRARQEDEAVGKMDGAAFIQADFRSIHVEGHDLVFREVRNTPRSCLCYSTLETTRCQGPVGETAECERLRLTGRRASKACHIPNCRIDYEIAVDGESLIESSDYKQPPGEPPFGPNTYKRKH